MSKIFATTYVICPVGQTIELYQDERPRVGQSFDIIHIDTKKVVQKAKVTSVEMLKPNWFHILAVITKQVAR